MVDADRDHFLFRKQVEMTKCLKIENRMKIMRMMLKFTCR